MFIQFNNNGFVEQYSNTFFEGSLEFAIPEDFLSYIKYDNNQLVPNLLACSRLSTSALQELQTLLGFENYPEWLNVKNNVQNKSLKNNSREIIRNSKDLEDDFVDTKQIVQWLIYGLLDVYSVLTPEQKTSLKYSGNFTTFEQLLSNPSVKMRVDIETDKIGKFTQILQDEVQFANIVKTEYFDKRVI